MSQSIARKVVASFQALPASNSSLPVLSKREKEILDIMSAGFRIKEIADKLNLSVNTVRSHIRNIYEKLQVTSRIEAMNKLGKNPYRA
jgi:DNA-binding NarL/FixJ family response regulator